MSYVALSALGASANVTATASVDTTKLTVQALQKIQQDPAIREQLSYLGDLFAQVATVAYESAAGVPLAQILSLGTTVLGQLGGSAGSIIPEILTELGSAVGGVVAGVGQMMPLFMAVMGAASAAAQAHTQMAKQYSDAACIDWYQRPQPSRSEVYGGMLPCDILDASVGNVFEVVAGQDCHLEELGGKKILICGPQTVFKRVGPKGIPPDTRALLKMLFRAIKGACKDPKSDGGLALWPVFLDLLYGQFRNGNMSWELANWMYDCEVLPTWKPPVGTTSDMSSQRCRCRSLEKRAWYEFQSVLTDWGQTVNPFYEMDKPKAAALRQKIQKVLAELRGKPYVSPLVRAATTQLTATMPKPASTTAAMTSAGRASWGLFALAALAVAGGSAWAYWRHQKGSRR